MKRALIVVVVAAALSAAAHAQPSGLLKKSTATRTKDDAASTNLGDYKGVKHAIGVVDISSDEGFYFEESARQNMRVMLESALFSTNRFVIVERGNLEAVMQEQELQRSQLASKGSQVAKTGRLRSARYLAACSVTEASSSTSGDDGGVTIKGITIGGSVKKASIVLVVKLIDTTTGEIVASERVRGEAGGTSIQLGYSGSKWSGDVGSFAKTPMGQAAQDCINKAVVFIASEMASTPVEGAVVSANEKHVIINLGENYGISVGQVFVVRQQGETLTDPDTGEILGRSEGEVVGVLEVTSTREKVAYCKVVDGEIPQRGDMVEVK